VPEWDAEIAVDGTFVRALLAEQFPDLDASSARLIGQGWDYAVWVLEERWAFRFPRRDVVIPGLEWELAVLPVIAPSLPVAIPIPTFVGRPSDRFPWPFFGAPFIPGLEPADAALDDEDRVELGAQLGVSCVRSTTPKSTSTCVSTPSVAPTCRFASPACVRSSGRSRRSGGCRTRCTGS
jgi:hypothetical protein